MPKATARKKKRPASSKTNKKRPAVRVRMYRQGLGDCFLVTFDFGGNEVHMLIDCGSLGATTTGVTLDKVVANIREVTKDHLHLLIATHEHQDHVCGFRNCKTDFKKIKKVDRIWMAWTENPQDEIARKIVKYKGDLGTAVATAANALTLSEDVDGQSKALGEGIKSILGFVGDPNALGAGGLAKTIDEAMQFVRKGFGKEARYLKPGGAAIEEDWLPGFRFYVLGPPRSLAALKDLGDHDSDQLYHITSGLSIGALYASDPTLDPATCENEMPFDVRFRNKANDPLVKQTLSNYFDDAQKWRRIDNDWLHAAADLALQLDSMTNNTSLALAIERVSDGRVLLFPADAQQGNWLSWHDANMKWTYDSGEGKKEKTAAQLLAETVFYKAGHHSSHNGTAKGKGLELMQREDELVAFIPVDRAVALKRNPKDSWQMPARPLYLHLLQRCQGRVARSDLGWADDAKNAQSKAVEKEFVKLADAKTWKKWKQAQQKANVEMKPLFIDYVLR